jgi:hypothetical protein
MDPMATPAYDLPRAGRWVRTGNSITLLNATDPAWDTADTKRQELQVEGALNEFETTPIPGTTHILDCAGGCAPFPAARCIAVLRQAISDAIKMALDAANKLDDALKPGSPTADTVNPLFRFFFGHNPTRPVEWAGGIASGKSIADWYRAVARELGGGRQITFRCGTAVLCGTAVAVTRHCDPAIVGTVEPNVINLCGPFWASPGFPGLAPEDFRAATILHEMLHVVFCEGFHDGGPPPNQFRRNNASCLEAFACRVNGFGADPSAVTACRSRPV